MLKKLLITLMLVALVFSFCACGQSKPRGKIIQTNENQIIEKMSDHDNFLLYIGRDSCPDCQNFYPDFEKEVLNSDSTVFTFDTEVPTSKKGEMREFIHSLGIEEIPSVIVFKNGSVVDVMVGIGDENINSIYEVLKEA